MSPKVNVKVNVASERLKRMHLKDSNETVAVAMRYLPAEHCVGWSAKVAASLEASGLVKPTRVGLERLDEL